MDFGGGTHVHDVEYIETRLAVARRPGCPECPWVLGLMRVTGKAHGIQWYDNTLAVDGATSLPVHILVEEGKHASCTDRNADGHYTPGFDVTERVNDAWGVRDTLGTGTFFTGHYQSWMTKMRDESTRVFPPLPEDSPLREAYTRDGQYASDNAVYVLRPYPRPESAAPDLKPYIADKGDPTGRRSSGHRSRAVRDLAPGRVLCQVVGALVSGGRGSRLVPGLPAADRQERAGAAGRGLARQSLLPEGRRSCAISAGCSTTRAPPPAGWTATSPRAGSATWSTWRRAARARETCS